MFTLKKVYYLVFLFAISLFTVYFASSRFTAASDDTTLGGIRLLDGYRHERLRGEDTAVGRISKDKGLSIEYDIGVWAGNHTAHLDKDKQKWTKHQEVAGREVLVVLMNDDRLFVVFPQSQNNAPANFWATVKSSEEITEMLLMVIGYPLPASSNSTQSK